jgi:hypothetical protein
LARTGAKDRVPAIDRRDCGLNIGRRAWPVLRRLPYDFGSGAPKLGSREGQRILVIENEFLISLEITSVLEQALPTPN